MQIIKTEPILLFSAKHPNSISAFADWVFKTNKANWSNFKDVKQTFNSVDSVGNDRYVFNIKGNQFRIVAMIFFIPKLVYIRFVGTHSEYDKIDCVNI